MDEMTDAAVLTWLQLDGWEVAGGIPFNAIYNPRRGIVVALTSVGMIFQTASEFFGPRVFEDDTLPEGMWLRLGRYAIKKLNETE